MKCQQCGIIPRNIRHTTKHLVPSFETARIQQLARKIEDSLHGELKKLRIKQMNITLNHLTGHLIYIRNTLEKTLEVEDYTNFIKRQITSYKIALEKLGRIKQHKLMLLKDCKFKQLGLTYNRDWRINNSQNEYIIISFE